MKGEAAPVVRSSGISKTYGKVPALDQITFDLPAGAFCGLIGTNGAGKTTILKCLLDFCDFAQGSIELFGLDHRRPESRRMLSYLPERFSPPFFLTGREFLKIMLRMSQADYNDALAIEMFTNLGLQQGALDMPVRSYSKGMTQKLGLAASFMMERSLLVLDEPMSGLDPLARVCVKRQLAKIKVRGNSTVLLTSHALADLEEICDHMILLHDSRIAYAGSPQAFRRESGEATLEQAFIRRTEIASRIESAKHV